MSFGFGGAGGSQGQIRYSLIVDDAMANQKLGTFKNSLTQLAPATAQVNQNMGALANNFKGVSGGLTQQNTLIGQAVTQHKTLGQTLSTNMQRFSGLATGLAATASGALQLAAGFRDYNDAQIAVDRTQRRLSLANEALGKAQTKLNALENAGVKSGKDYEQAALDVQQALAQQAIQTQLLGEAQERMFDSQTQFVVSVVPTVLGAVGSLGAAFKAFGGSLGGISSKIKGLSSEWMSFAGAAGGAGFAFFIIQQVDAAQKKLDELGVKFQKLPGLLFATQTQMKAATEEYDIIIEKTGRSLAQILFDAEGTKKAWIDAGGAVDKAGNIIFDTKTKVSDLGEGFKATTDDYAKWAAQMQKDGATRDEIIKWLTDSKIKLSDQTIILEKAAKVTKDTSEATGEFNVQLEKEAKVLKEVNELVPITALAMDDWRMKLADTLIITGGQAGLTSGKEIGEGMATGLKASEDVVNTAGSHVIESLVNQQAQDLNARVPELGKAYMDMIRAATQPAIDEVLKVSDAAGRAAIAHVNRVKEAWDQFWKGIGTQRLETALDIKVDEDKITKKILDYMPDSVSKDIKLEIKGAKSVAAATKSFEEIFAKAADNLNYDDAGIDEVVEGYMKYLKEKFPDSPQSKQMQEELAKTIAGDDTEQKVKALIAKWEKLEVPGEVLIQGIDPGDTVVEIDPSSLGSGVRKALGISSGAKGGGGGKVAGWVPVEARIVRVYAELPDPSNPFYSNQPKGDGTIPFKPFEKKEPGPAGPVDFTSMTKNATAVFSQIKKQFDLMIGKFTSGSAAWQGQWSSDMNTMAKNTAAGGKKSSKAFDQMIGKFVSASSAFQGQWSSDMNQMAKNTSSGGKKVTKEFDKMIGKMTSASAALASQWSSDMNSMIRNAKSMASGVNKALNSIQDEEVKINYVRTGAVPGRQHGYHGTVTGPTLFVAGEAGPERIDVTPGNEGSSRRRNMTARGGGDTIINATFKIDGNEIINTRRLEQKIRLVSGGTMDKFGA